MSTDTHCGDGAPAGNQHFCISLGGRLFDCCICSRFHRCFTIGLRTRFIFTDNARGTIQRAGFTLDRFGTDYDCDIDSITDASKARRFAFITDFEHSNGDFRYVSFLDTDVDYYRGFDRFDFRFDTAYFRRFGIFLND